MAGTRTFRTIKKYPNRRLYDTEKSRYITLSDIRDLVLENVEFTVVDSKTREDITRCILLQVICEYEQNNGDAILSEAFLSQVIRAYGNPFSDLLADHLQRSLNSFVSHQTNVSRDAPDLRYEPITPETP